MLTLNTILFLGSISSVILAVFFFLGMFDEFIDYAEYKPTEPKNKKKCKDSNTSLSYISHLSNNEHNYPAGTHMGHPLVHNGHINHNANITVGLANDLRQRGQGVTGGQYIHIAHDLPRPWNNHHTIQTKSHHRDSTHTTPRKNIISGTYNQPLASSIIPSFTEDVNSRLSKSKIDTNILTGLQGTKPLITINRMDLLSKDMMKIETDDEFTICNGKIEEARSFDSSDSYLNVVCQNVARLTLSELAIDMVIGGGAFGQVWKGLWNGTPVAVKILNTICQNSIPKDVIKEFEEEVSLLARLRHPNICMMLGVCLDPPNRAIVTELLSRGSLWELLRTPGLFDNCLAPPSTPTHNALPQNIGSFHWPMWVTRRVLDGTCRGLIYLHKQNIIHRDLKSANLLLDDSFHVKICDFGLARLKDFTTVMTAQVGTVQWMSPEVLTGKQYNESTDIYSLGIVIWEILTGLCPFNDMTQVEAAIAIVHKGLRPPIPSECTAAQSLLLKNCWNANPLLRYTSSQVLSELEKAFPIL